MLLIKNKGFTLVKVMVTAGIVALIMAIIYGVFAGRTSSSGSSERF